MDTEAPTLLAEGNAAHALAHAHTVATEIPASGVKRSFTPPTSARTTVLPRVDGDQGEVKLSIEERARYEPVKLLGAGGMGEVVLVEDHDIARKVAIKRLLPEMTEPALLARFIEEIRTVGRLEHPNIVPIHDVGVDELGRYFFVMKYVEGETLEHILHKLSHGDPEYHARYSYEKRMEIFLGLLRALRYAHEHGVVHRDIKPANVMVGRYGEVMLMDWGIAKPIDAKRDHAAAAEGSLVTRGGDDAKGERARMFATRVGSFVGTPAYMSPEQARGENDRVDARSDVFSASVLLHELISLRHVLEGASSVDEMLVTVASKDRTFWELFSTHHPQHGPGPAELVHLAQKGMSRDPAQRWQSAAEMIRIVEEIMEGRLQVQCHVTMTKRMTRELSRFVDRHPTLGFVTFVTVTLGLIGGTIFGAVSLIQRLLA